MKGCVKVVYIFTLKRVRICKYLNLPMKLTEFF